MSGGPALADRLARALVASAARRWPADLAGDLHAEWRAEMACLPPRRRLVFAAGLALSPAVDQPPRTVAVGRAAAVAGGVTLLAGALVNAAHVAGGPGLLILAAAGMAALGTRVRTAPAGLVLLLGAALFGFLFTGNAEAVMPFMGFRDVAPAVLVWTALMLATVPLARRAGTAVAGGLLAVTAAVAAGNLHAAAALGVATGSAPAWFPLALLPGGTVAFGPHLTGPVGGLPAGGPAYQASDLLLANAAATAGPMLLCTIFALVVAHRARRTAPAPVSDRRAPARRRIGVGVGAALAGLAAAEVFWRTTPGADVMLHRLLDHSAAFGFGFLAHPAGRAGLALLAGLLAIRAVDATAARAPR